MIFNFTRLHSCHLHSLPWYFVKTCRLLLSIVLLFSIALSAARSDELDSRREKIEQMTAIEKDQLRGKQQRFDNLSPAAKEKYRTLHHTLATHKNSEHLKAVMNSYYKWLGSLDTVERSELQNLPPQERIARIKQLMGKQERERFRELSSVASSKCRSEDIATIKDWIKVFVKKNQKSLLAIEAELPKSTKQRFAKLNHLTPERKAFALWFWTLRSRHEKRILPQKEELLELSSHLHPETQEMLEKLQEDQRIAVMNNWFMAAVFSSSRDFVFKMPAEELQKFHQSLPADIQRKLASLPPEEFEKKLRMEYMKRNFIGRGHRGRRPPTHFDANRKPNGKNGNEPSLLREQRKPGIKNKDRSEKRLQEHPAPQEHSEKRLRGGPGVQEHPGKRPPVFRPPASPHH